MQILDNLLDIHEVVMDTSISNESSLINGDKVIQLWL
jgi:hypothetical protein